MQSSRIRHIAAGVIAQFPARVPLAGAAALVTAGALSGCSIAIPMSSSPAMWRGSPDDVTGSIGRPALRLSRKLDAEDLRRAGAAMNTALDPQGSGASVNWDNPQSGARGSFTPVGQPYPLDGKICRAFLATVSADETQERLEGAACREKTADWALTEAKPARKG